MGDNMFQQVKTFLNKVVQQLDVQANKYRIGVSQFSDDAQAEVLLNTFKGKNQVLNHIKKNLVYKAERVGELKTGVAIKHAIDVHFKESSGSRLVEGIPQFLVIITSGSSKYDPFQQAVNSVKKHGVKIVPIGVQNTNMKEWEDMGIKYFNLSADNLTPLSRNIHNLIKTEKENQFKRAGPPPAGCVETEEADIYFLMDGSGSIKPQDFLEVKTFLIEMVEMFNIGPDNVRIGAVQYASNPELELNITHHSSKIAIQQAIQNIRQVGGGTRTGEALHFMLKCFQSAVTTRPTTVPQYLVTLTDGESEDEVRQVAETLRKKGVLTYAIGVKDANKTQLLEISGSDDRFFYVYNFDSLKDIKNKVVQEICSQEACKKVKADIIFLIDSSGSIVEEDFKRMKQFVENIVKKSDIGVDKVQVGAIQFSYTQKEEFTLNKFSLKTDLQEAIRNMSQLYGGTLTGQALSFTSKYFESAKGGRSDVDQFLIVITDGEAQDEVAAPAEALRNKGITVFSIGVFGSNNTQLEEISGSQNKVFFIESYDALSSILNTVFFGICHPQKDCKIERADIVFLIDGSDSISPTDFQTMKEFLKAMVINFDIRPNRVHIGVAQFSHKYAKQFYLRSFTDTSTFQNQIENIRQITGSTYIANALRNVKDFFTTSAGSRKSEGVEQILLVITDGVAQDRDEVYQAAEDLRQDSITIYALGIGDIDVYQLIQIAGTPDRKFMVKNFNELVTIKTRFVRNICEDPRDAKCAIDIAVGFDITSQKPGQQIFSDQHKLQVFLPEILKEMTSLQTISCVSGSQIQISFGFEITNSEPVYETQFKTLSPDIVTELSSQWVVKPSYLNRAFLESLWKKFEKSENKTKDHVAEKSCCGICCKCLGDEGLIGNKGPKGQKGSNGSFGRVGHPGEEGTPGIRGPPGLNGTQGFPGCEGLRGLKVTAAVDPREATAVADPREATAGAGPREVTAAVDPREAPAAAVDPREAMAAAGPWDVTAAVDPREVPAGADPREATAVVDPREAMAAAVDPQEATAGAGPREATAAADPREETAAADPREATLGILDADIQLAFAGLPSAANAVPAEGESGNPGDKGEVGTLGPRGVQGDIGFPGYTGPQGNDGDPGNPGARGPKGIRGRRGESGPKGDPGSPGDLGYPGHKECELINYIRQNCRARECPVYPTELVFALDMSAEVTTQSFTRMKEMVLSILEDLSFSESNCPTGTRVSLVSYSYATKYVIRFNDYHRKKQLLKSVKEIPLERTTGRRNIGAAMKFVARNSFKRIRKGTLVRKMAIIFADGPSQDAVSISTAAMEFSALDITPVVIAFQDLPNIKRAFAIDDTGRFQFINIPTKEDPKIMLENLKLCSLCYDTCNPDPTCLKIKNRPSPVQMDMDVAFLLDSSRTMSSDNFERSKEFLHSVLDQFVITNQPRTSDPGARVALVQHTSSGYTQREEQNPVNLEFDFVAYSSKKQMKRHIKESLHQLQSDSGVGHALEWTMNNLFSKVSKARSTKVIFAVIGGDTSFWDKKKLAEIALNAKCQGFTIFALTIGGPINDTEVEQLASFPFSHHSCQLGKVLDLDMDYALKFTHAFFSLVANKINNYPPKILQRKCERLILQEKQQGDEVPMSAPERITAENVKRE
ncbi:Collagen alpha-6(VI) chain [Acipenser ruthenus]|uniref:Collagen alpha-6(VI) chain n=1 Tax=Acipenser ruthenus TaxID=7906 RepID=A0A444UJU1_ACIRT|nr:Collagen alpha-6(VI) chain [Acipenser ruthenus]